MDVFTFIVYINCQVDKSWLQTGSQSFLLFLRQMLREFYVESNVETAFLLILPIAVR